MVNTEQLLIELQSIGTFLRRVDAASASPASAGITTVAQHHGFGLGYQGRDFSVLANAEGCSIAFGRLDGYWLLKNTDSKTYMGQGADQLQFQLKQVGMNAGGPAPDKECKTPTDARFTKDTSKGAADKSYDTFTHPAGHKLTVAPSGNWKMRLATGKTDSSKDTKGSLGDYLNDNRDFFHNKKLDDK